MTDYTQKADRDKLLAGWMMENNPTVKAIRDACDALEARAEAAEERAKWYDMGVCPNLAHLDLEERIAELERERDGWKEMRDKSITHFHERIADMEKSLIHYRKHYHSNSCPECVSSGRLLEAKP